MLRLMIVDDEPVVRRGIRESIDWQQHNVQIVAEAGDGESAAEKVEEARPDVIIADIRMPRCNGIEFSRTVKSRHPSTRVVILSGYADFEYAQQAVRLGAEDYLLKPVGADELIRLITRLRDEIQRERSSGDGVHEDGATDEETVLGVLNGTVSGPERSTLLARAGLAPDGVGFLATVAMVEVDEPLQESSAAPDGFRLGAVQRFLISGMRQARETGGLSARLEGGVFAAVLPGGPDDGESISRFCVAVRETAREADIGSVTIGLSAETRSPESLRHALVEARAAVRSKAYLGKNRTIRYDQAVESEEVHLRYPRDVEDLLVHALRAGDSPGVDRISAELMSDLSARRVPLEEAHQVALRMYFSCVRALDEVGIETTIPESTEAGTHIEVQSRGTFREIELWLQARVHGLMRQMHDHEHPSRSHFVTRATGYLERHFRSAPTLQEVAGEVCITPNYLSKLLHEQTGKTFTQWLHEFQIAEAKRLLAETALRTYEVAERVGHRDYKHFSRTFKRAVGCSPAEYRDRIAATTTGPRSV